MTRCRASVAPLLMLFVLFGFWSSRASPVEAVPDAAGLEALTGLWEARLRFGPDLEGTLLLRRYAAGWKAEIGGVRADATVRGDHVSIRMPDGRGRFQGTGVEGGGIIEGHWTQPATVSFGMPFASPVVLHPEPGGDLWRGRIDPLADAFTMYLRVGPGEEGILPAFLKNPERNVGRFTRISAARLDGHTVHLLGEAGADGTRPVLATGLFDGDVLRVPLRGGTYDFRRVGTDEGSDFFPRRHPDVGAAYVYSPPPTLDDGWATASPEQVGLSREGLERFVRWLIDLPIDGVSALEVHGILIARHGRLVLEEYFHGEHREKPHDTRSAAKSVTSTLIGAAIEAGILPGADVPVYERMGVTDTMTVGSGKRSISLEHLLTMSSGLDCDDRDPGSAGNEDVVQERFRDRDWWDHTLGLDLVRDPGSEAVYCSMSPHLAGGVLERAAGVELPRLFHELVARPLRIDRYWLPITPSDHVYSGGGARFLPRDFIKIGQLLLDGGEWNGRRVVSREWAERSTSSLKPLRSHGYGYLWWVIEYPHEGRQVRAFFAGGNGGQLVIAIPELGLTVAAFGGNYSDPVFYRIQEELVPEFVLPAVRR